MDSLTQAVSRWPGVDAVGLRARLEAAVSHNHPAPERLDELTLTQACAMGHGPALEAFDVILREESRRALRRHDAAQLDELTQLVRERLLLTDRLAGFRAEAPLRAWVRAVVVRTAINAQKVAGRELPLEEADGVEASAADPELALLRQRYRDSFKASFAAAVAALSPRERTILRLHTLDGLTLARIGAVYQKDTSTVSRWLEQSRRALLESTRGHLALTLALSGPELDSLMRVADSELSVSLSRLL